MGSVIQSKRSLILVLLLPILALTVLTAYRKTVLSFGNKVVLPISGYDPRDLLSGHYLIYQIDYGIEGVCSQNGGKQSAYICLGPKLFSYTAPEQCSLFIRGICHNRHFKAGIEKYFVPEDQAKELEKHIRSKTASIVISVTKDGYSQVNDLLINGKSWKNL